jgi:succinyl-CoA synthetase beta subunit
MKIHEYQAKDILRRCGVPVPDGEMATTLEEAETAAKALFGKGNAAVVVKAQIHAGGRGKGGGVKVVKTIEDANAAAKAILGMQLVTHQTGPAGQKVQRLLRRDRRSSASCTWDWCWTARRPRLCLWRRRRAAWRSRRLRTTHRS